MIIRRLLTVLILPAILVGCKGPEKVIQILPPPVVPMVSTPQPLPPATVKPPEPTGRSLRGAVIMVDAGHGGVDPGAWKGTKSNVPEKTIVLDIALKVGRILSDRGAKVIYTRTTDVFPSLEDRAQLAERSRADLFVSIHANASERSSASGIDVYIYEKASMESQKAAFRLVAAFARAGIDCRGIARGNFHVLREHSRPAVLIECGFLTNSGDAGRLNTSSYRSTMAEAIVEGVTDYFSR